MASSDQTQDNRIQENYIWTFGDPAWLVRFRPPARPWQGYAAKSFVTAAPTTSFRASSLDAPQRHTGDEHRRSMHGVAEGPGIRHACHMPLSGRVVQASLQIRSQSLAKGMRRSSQKTGHRETCALTRASPDFASPAWSNPVRSEPFMEGTS